jgi:hypothetical protein
MSGGPAARIGAVVAILACAGGSAACTTSGGGTPSAHFVSVAPSVAGPPSPAASPSTPPIPSTSISSTAPAGTMTATATPPAIGLPSPSRSVSAVVLGPNGFGPLRLGMTPAQAMATHLTSAASVSPGQACPTGRLLHGPSAGTPSLFFSPTLGLAAIYAYPGITTPAGVTLGSPLVQLQQAYPSWLGLQGGAEGIGYVAVTGSTEYRITVSGGRVVELAIQLDDEDCYD